MEPYSLEKQPVKQVKFAGFWIRFAAYLLDSIIISIPLTIIMIVIMVFGFGTMDVFADPAALENEVITDQQAISLLFLSLLMILIGLIGSTAYYAGMHASKWQATVGKKLLKLKVTDLQGNRISFWRAFGRLLAMSFLSGIFYIGYIMAAFTEKKQSLHDLIAGTVVVEDN
ncbi:RDD family protein [Neobacillus vireti]|uniref:RDD family protein n=1 Tax=Neobacillus vireti LMG 21834 TaxID=1131730 RepID=A0AB94IMC7_9BACI|nr:RDD family protein [Neobacillus vireti]ETI68093.1 RDD family protein [Neobacillus vireti LMG 21834]KLT19362.1 membrane protein YxaI [Neobacillus vireti]